MATNLGTLTLNLLANFGSYTQGLSNAERQTRDSTSNMSDAFSGFGAQIKESLGGTQISSIIGDVTARLEGMQGSVLIATAGLAGLAVGGTALAIGGLAKLSIETAKADSEMAMLATRAKVGIESFQIFTYAAEQLGISQDQLGSIFADVQEKLGEFSATGGGGAADFFDALKNNTKLTDDQIKAFSKTLQGKDGVEAVQMLKDKLDDLGASSQEQRFVFESLASDLTNLMPLFSEGGAKVEEYGKALQDAGVIKSKEAIQQSQILAAQTQAVNLQFQGAKNQLVQGFMPAMTSVAEAMFSSSKEGIKLQSVGDGLGKILLWVGKTAIGVSTTVQLLGDGLGGLIAISVQAAQGNFKEAAAIYRDSQSQFDKITADGAARLEQLSTVATGSSSKLTEAILQLNQAQNVTATGLKINTKDAEENAKAKEAQAKAAAKAAKAQEDLNKMVGASALSGLRIKGAETIAGGGVRGYTAEFAKMTQDLLGDQLVRFTSLNDKYHQGKGGKHPVGQAFDFTVKDAADADQSIQRIQEMAKKYGFAIKTLNEYLDPSRNATGGHIHVSVLGYNGSADALKEANAEVGIISKANADAIRIQEESAKNQLAINYKYATEEQKMAFDNQEAIKAIKLAYAEGDPSRQTYLDLQKAAYARDVDEFQKAQQEKKEAAWGLLNDLARDAAIANIDWSRTAAEMIGGAAQFQLWQQRDSRYSDSFNLYKTKTNVLNKQAEDPAADLQTIADQKESLWKAHNDRMAAIDQDYWVNSTKLNLSYGEQISGSFVDMAKSMYGEQSSTYRAMFSVQKAFAIASSLVSISQGIAYAAANPFPYNLGAMATVAASTASLVSNIQSVKGFATGGLITGKGTGTSDEIPIWASNKEYMIRAAAVDKVGVGALDYINRTGELPKGFAAGGVVNTKVLDTSTNPALSSYINDRQKGDGVNVNVYTLPGTVADISTNSNGELDVRIRQIAGEVAEQTVVAGFNSQNSRIGKAVKQNYNVAPRR